MGSAISAPIIAVVILILMVASGVSLAIIKRERRLLLAANRRVKPENLASEDAPNVHPMSVRDMAYSSHNSIQSGGFDPKVGFVAPQIVQQISCKRTRLPRARYNLVRPSQNQILHLCKKELKL